MIRVVLDTNVLVSAVLVPESIPAKILSMVKDDKIELVFSPFALAEVLRVFRYPKLISLMKTRSVDPEEAEDFIKALSFISLITLGGIRGENISGDPNDDRFLACAVESEAQFIVSGDRHLIDLKSFQGIPIVTPAEFIKASQRDY